MSVLWRVSVAAALWIAINLVCAPRALAQQLLKGVTGPQCAAQGGRIIAWSNTAGSGANVGECLVPAPGAGSASTPSRAPPPPSAAGIVGGFGQVLNGLNALQNNEPPSTSPAPARPEAAPEGDDRSLQTAFGVYRLAADLSRQGEFCRAAETFRLAARHFQRAGHTKGRDDALFQASLVLADCEDKQKAREAAADAPPKVGTCVPYFQKMRKLFRDNAAACLKETRLLQSLTDMLGSAKLSSGDASFTRASAPSLFGILDASDPGWSISGDVASPKCAVPLRVRAQNEAFSECARVYLCGAIAASCGERTARKSSTADCVSISQACIAKHPVPQNREAKR